jgi:hypothetical protein
MLKFEANLVGMHFRPPAKDVVNNLAANTELLVRRQPDNPYDTNALQVLLEGFCEGGENEPAWEAVRQIKWEELGGDENGEGELDEENQLVFGEYCETVLTDPLPLGYICNGEKTGGKKADMISPQMDAIEMTSVPGKLSFNEKGLPIVVIEASFEPRANSGTDTQDPSINTDVA